MTIIDRFRLDGKKAFVTGAAGGIGKATATALAEAGADVAIVDLPANEEKSRQIAREIASGCGVKAIAVSTDVSDPQRVDEMIATILDAFGTIDVVHSNAGVISGGAFDVDIDYADWKRNIDINLGGMFLVGRASARVMIKNGKGGSIINTASMSGIVVNDMFNGAAGGSAYATAKAGLIHLTKAQAVQWVGHNIRVNSISPGYVLSGIHDGMPGIASVMDYMDLRTPMKRMGRVDELQGAVLYLASDASSYTTGTNIVVDGGYIVW